MIWCLYKCFATVIRIKKRINQSKHNLYSLSQVLATGNTYAATAAQYQGQREIDEFSIEEMWMGHKKNKIKLHPDNTEPFLSYCAKGCQCQRVPQDRVRKMAPKVSTHRPTTQACTVCSEHRAY